MIASAASSRSATSSVYSASARCSVAWSRRGSSCSSAYARAKAPSRRRGGEQQQVALERAQPCQLPDAAQRGRRSGAARELLTRVELRGE